MSRNNRAISTWTMSMAAVCAALTAGDVIAQTDLPSVKHFLDTSTDRVPALTAFPKYPSIARRDRIEGEATVCFKIRANGKISSASVKSSSHRIFSRPSIRAIKKSSFEPLGPGQVLARAKTCRTYRFRLDPIALSNNTT